MEILLARWARMTPTGVMPWPQSGNSEGRNMTLNIVRDQARAVVSKALDRPEIMPFRASPILPPDPTDPRREHLRKTHRTAKASWLYINRKEGEDRFGPLPNGYMSKAGDLVASGRRHPLHRYPLQYRTGPVIWEEADAAAALDPAGAAGIHIVASLPRTAPGEWQRLIERYIDDSLVSRGMVVDWAVHALGDDSGDWATHPHVHMIVSARRFRADMRKGQRQRSWLFNASQIDQAEDAWLAITGLQRLPYTA